MDVLLDALGYQARQPHQEDVSTSSTDAQEELLECVRNAHRAAPIGAADTALMISGQAHGSGGYAPGAGRIC